MRTTIGICALLSITCAAFGQPVIDGTVDASYEIPTSIQTNYTNLGDNNIIAPVGNANGSELDVAYATVAGNVMYLTLAGNLKADGTYLELFFDTKAGGQNRLLANNINRPNFVNMCDDGTGNGLTFTNGFQADYWIGIKVVFNVGLNRYDVSGEYGVIGSNTSGRLLGTAAAGGNGTLAGGNNPNGVKINVNNANTVGVTIDTAAPARSSGWGVATGVEISIPYADIGNPPTIPAKVCAIVTDPTHTNYSSQVLDGQGIIAGPFNAMKSTNLCAHSNDGTGQRVFMVYAVNNTEWFRIYATGGAEDQTKDCVIQFSGLIGPALNGNIPPMPVLPDTQPGSYQNFFHAVYDGSFKVIMTPAVAAAKCQWAFGQCYSGGMLDDLATLNGTQCGASASRYNETALYNTKGANREDWVSRYIDAIGNGTVTARDIAKAAAKNNPFGPAKDGVVAPARDAGINRETPASESSIYMTTGAAADGLKMNTAVNMPQAKGYAIIWSGIPSIIDRDQVNLLLTKMITNNGWKPARVTVFYGGGDLGNAHPLKAFENLGVKFSKASKEALIARISGGGGGLFRQGVGENKPNYLFFLANDHGFNTAKPAIAKGTDGGPAPQQDPDVGDDPSTPMFDPVDFLICDANCDQLHNGRDVAAFVMAMFNPALYSVRFPGCPLMDNDMNGDGFINAGDVPLLVNCLMSL